MSGYLLDSNIAIDALNGRRGRTRLLLDFAVQGQRVAISTISVIEIYAGMRPAERLATDEFMRLVDVLDVSRDIAFVAGRLSYDWARRGKTLTVPDATIAATALQHAMTLITDNRRDFPMPELKFYEHPTG